MLLLEFGIGIRKKYQMEENIRQYLYLLILMKIEMGNRNIGKLKQEIGKWNRVRGICILNFCFCIIHYETNETTIFL